MASGSRSGKRPSRRFSAAAALIAGAVSLTVSCARGGAFDAALAALDSAMDSGTAKAVDSAFSRAYGKAAASADWLSILKRARVESRAGTGRLVEAAVKASRSKPATEPVAEACAWAFLRSGKPREALALFGDTLPRERHGGLFAECLAAAARAGLVTATEVEPVDFASIADATGRSEPLAGAALIALAHGDLPAAASWAARAREGGFRVPASLLWDCGLYAELASGPDRAEGSEPDAIELAVMGDAAWKVGDLGLARTRWMDSLALDPRSSWRSYEKLAATAAGPSEAGSYRSRMKAAFVDAPRPAAEAAVAVALPLVASGRGAEAATLLAPFGADPAAQALRLRAESLAWPPGRTAAEALAMASKGGAAETGYALAILFEIGAFEDLLALFDSAEARGTAYPDRWFFEAAARAARGEFARAAAAAEAAGRGPEAGLAAGVAYRAARDPRKAAPLLEAASKGLAGPAARCAALKELGGALRDAGDADGSAAAFKAAARADPSDSEAAQLARAGR